MGLRSTACREPKDIRSLDYCTSRMKDSPPSVIRDLGFKMQASGTKHRRFEHVPSYPEQPSLCFLSIEPGKSVNELLNPKPSTLSLKPYATSMNQTWAPNSLSNSTLDPFSLVTIYAPVQITHRASHKRFRLHNFCGL